jgi:hypothetical protein
MTFCSTTTDETREPVNNSYHRHVVGPRVEKAEELLKGFEHLQGEQFMTTAIGCRTDRDDEQVKDKFSLLRTKLMELITELGC